MELTRTQSSGLSFPQSRLPFQDLRHGKRRRLNSETAAASRKRCCVKQHQRTAYSSNRAEVPSQGQLLSPRSTISLHSVTSITRRKRKSSSSHPLPSKRARSDSEHKSSHHLINRWLSNLPDHHVQDFDDMSHSPTKRSRSTDSLAGRSSGEGSDTAVSRDKKYSMYKDINYPMVLETKGSFMKSSKLGMIAADRDLCKTLFSTPQPIPQDDLFDDDHFREFHTNLRGRSEARICADLHPRIMPSVENLFIRGQPQFEALREGHNDPWSKSVLFYGPRPQPDHTIGFKWSTFTDEQRRKLNIEPTKKSHYTAREDIYFPFLTGEVKCGRQALSLADASNANSMTVFQQGIVHLYRQLDRADEVHRRVLGFSISHDDNNISIYGHYPEIDGDKTTYWRETLNTFNFEHDQGKDRWKCYQFTLNACETFAPLLLKRLIEPINQLPDPATQSFGPSATLDDVSVSGSKEDSVIGSQDERFKRPSGTRGLNAELRSLIQTQQDKEKQLMKLIQQQSEQIERLLERS